MENDLIMEMIFNELKFAEKKHPGWPVDNLKKEVAQVGAMAIRMLKNL